MVLLRRSPIVSFLAGIAVLALLGFGIYRVVHRVSKIGSDSATGGADSDSLYRAGNFGTAAKAVRGEIGAGGGGGVGLRFSGAGIWGRAAKAVRGEIGAGGDVLELRIEAKRAKFTVRE